MTVKFGIDVLQEQAFAPLQGKHIGLLTNASGVDARLQSTVHILHGAEQVELVALFAPEHGMYNLQADSEHVDYQVDGRTGLPVYSLYGQTVKPKLDWLHGLDAVVCDIQDIGVRFYTYLWTLSHLLEVAAECDIEVIILDRPNPLSDFVSGPLLEADQASLVGRFPVPVCHGMTLGEIIKMINQTWLAKSAELQIVRCEGWQRTQTWPHIDRLWVPPSPNMPHLSTLYHYPGSCLVEGTNLSEGRGTALPFEVIGAPWVDADLLAEHLNAYAWPGVMFRPHHFRPSASKFTGVDCGGVQVHITDLAQWNALQVWLGVLCEIQRMYPDNFVFLPSVKPKGLIHFDRLIGNIQVREQIRSGRTLDEITADWYQHEQDFAAQRQLYLMYS